MFETKSTEQMASDSGSFTAPCVLKLDGDYEHWSLVIENLLCSNEYWSAIQSSFEEPGNEALSAAQQKAINETRLKDFKANNYLSQSIDKSILKTIIQKILTSNCGIQSNSSIKEMLE